MVAMSVASQVPTWVALTSEEAEEVDEPPELIHRFERTAIRCQHDQPSMLTKALMGDSDEHPLHHPHPITRSILGRNQRRRSMTSNVSIASTADLTSDTGMTSPCRTNTPSPPIPEMAALRLCRDIADRNETPAATNTVVPLPPKKRCIQFVCPAKPLTAQPMIKAPSAEYAPRRPTIKFACAAPRPSSTQNTPPRPIEEPIAPPSLPINSGSPSTPKKASALSAALLTSPQPSAIRLPPVKTGVTRPKFLRADSKDLVKDGSQFHAFASGVRREEDWIRETPSTVSTKLTIQDTLAKENHIRRLGAEVEAEAEMEEAEEAEDEEDEDEDDDGDESDDDDAAEEDDDDDDSDGYHTDSETGFAASDDEDDEDENMIMWTPSHVTARRNIAPSPMRSLSHREPQSDSSAASHASRSSMRRVRTRRIKIKSDAPDLPDSTDFVCGTLDEDRPLEEAYLSCLAARRNEKLRIIPQDIDPSFPASDPDDDDDDDEEEIFKPGHRGSDEGVWVQGKMEDLHHGQQDRSRRRKRNEPASPRKLRSPAPVLRRHHSPPPKTRGRSPKPLFGRQSPRRMRSPAPKALHTPSQTPRQGPHVQFYLAGRPGMTVTKSLPRPLAPSTGMKASKSTKQQNQSDGHLRGAIDIVKGLERKRQRRKEKFFQKYCNRARRGQIPERKPQPGRGAERMREIGLLMAGKKDHGNYVLSV